MTDLCRIGALFFSFAFFVACEPVHAQEQPVARYTYFLRVFDDSPNLNVHFATNSVDRTVLQLHPGDLVRVQLTDDEYKAHFGTTLSGLSQWIALNRSNFEITKVWARARDLQWIDAYRSNVILKRRTQPAPIFFEPEVDSLKKCLLNKAACVIAQADDSRIELIDSKIVAGATASEPWSLFYRVLVTQPGEAKRKGWVQATDYETREVLGVQDLHAPALDEDLLEAKSERQEIVERFMAPQKSEVRNHFDLRAELAQFSLDSDDLFIKHNKETGLGPRIGVYVQAPLLNDFSTNIYFRYGQIALVESGARNRFSQVDVGDEILYGKGSTESHFKFGLGANAAIFNNAPVTSLRVLAGGRMVFIYDGEKFFASYRGGIVANTQTGLGISNFEILPALGMHLDNDRHGWCATFSYEMAQAHVTLTSERMRYTVWSIGLTKGL